MKPPTTAPLRTLAFALALLLVCWQHAAGAESAGLIRIAGPIGPATASYIARALDEATQQGDVCAIIQLDTPGGLIGQTARALSAITAEGGTVFVEGEYWRAQSDTPIAAGAPAEVTGVEGLSLKVKPKKPEV